MSFIEEVAMAEKFCRQAFENLPALLKSRRIGCFNCGYVFIYDGSNETLPMSLDGLCGMCPSCDHFSLIGDATAEFSQSDLLNCRALITKWRFGEMTDPPPAVELFIACNFNNGIIQQASSARCLACEAEIIPAPPMFLTANGENTHSYEVFLCPHCLAPMVVPGNKYAFLLEICKKALK